MAEERDIMETLSTVIAPWRWLTAPVFRGLDRIPENGRLLFVGNHTLMGGLDVPLMMEGLWRERGIRLCILGDRIHFKVPGWRNVVERFGVIEGSPENCSQAMEDGRAVLVFPGGAREVMKHRDEKHTLLWGDRTGFARLAISQGYTIVPFASVGADDCWDILLDGGDLMKSPLRSLIERFHPRPDFIPPVLRGIGLSSIPRPERFYFHFGDPIRTDVETLRGREGDPGACYEVREQARVAVEQGIATLLELREHDPERDLGARVRARLGGLGP
jgi:1-acyl-sn-glycerol-3-phosphate acyltransferase